ncbi:MAG TPA: ComEA family DNA-binding protein [Gaiellaceae bacterium]
MDLSTVTRGRAIAGALLLIGALFLGGRYLAGAGTAKETQVTAESSGALEAAPAPRLVVHVVGAVRRPGLYRLRDGSRIADAVHRAGGATRHADLSLVNLAAPVSDGTQVVVPRRAPPAAPGAPPAEGPAAAAGPVHLNTATVEQLDELPGVGPVTAQKIVDYREQHGAFSSVDDLDAIPGIGPARLEQLRELVAP